MNKSQITYIDNKLCIPAQWLYSEYEIKGIKLPPLMERHQYEYRVKSGQIFTVGHPGPGKPAMVEWERLAEDIKNRIIVAIDCNPYSAVKRNLIEKVYARDEAAADFYFKFQFEDSRYIKEETREQYTVNASLFNAFTTIINGRKSMAFKHIGSTKGEMWANLAEYLGELDTNKFPHKLPKHPNRLRIKYDEYIQNGYEVFIHEGHGNKSASKISEDEQEAVLNRLLSSGNNLDNVQISMLYNAVAEPLGWEKITASTVAGRRKKTEALTDGGRLGIAEFRNKQTMQVTRRAPEAALQYWTLDGWQVELLYQKTETDKKGYSYTTYHNRLTMVVVLDTAGKYPIGYAVGTHETPELIRQALQNAVIHTQELFGQMYKPVQIQSDNYGRGNLTPLYKEMSKYYTPARAHNAKAKVIEPWFKQLNKTWCQLQFNWSGHNITSRKENQPNSELLQKNRKDFPDENGCRKQIDEIMQLERKRTIEKYQRAFEKSHGYETIPIGFEQYLYLFGQTTGHKNRLEPSGLHITINGEKRVYDSFDRDFRMLNEAFTIKFDNNNLEKVLAVNDDGTRRFVLTEKYVQPMNLTDRSETDAAELAKINSYNMELESTVIEFNRNNYELTDKVLQDDRLNGTLAKIMLTNSRGEHKNQKNKAIREKGIKMIEAEEIKELKQVEKSFKETREDYLDDKFDFNKYTNL